jgi:hypothetical protein
MASRDDSREFIAVNVSRAVSVPDAFLFFVDAQKYTGEFATSLTDLLSKLQRVPLESIEFHFRRGDFERWVGRAVGDEVLADRLRRIDRLMRGEELRAAIKETIRKRLGEFSQAV